MDVSNNKWKCNEYLVVASKNCHIKHVAAPNKSFYRLVHCYILLIFGTNVLKLNSIEPIFPWLNDIYEKFEYFCTSFFAMVTGVIFYKISLRKSNKSVNVISII